MKMLSTKAPDRISVFSTPFPQPERSRNLLSPKSSLGLNPSVVNGSDIAAISSRRNRQ